MEVVGHERETPQAPTKPPDRLLQPLEQPPVVTLVLEDRPPLVATGVVRDIEGGLPALEGSRG